MVAVGSYPDRTLQGVIHGSARVQGPDDVETRADVIKGALLSAAARLPAALSAVAARSEAIALR
jgi:hypothetical protein